MSELRSNIKKNDKPLPESMGEDMKSWVVFTQKKRGAPHIYAGWLNACDEEMALDFAREHYGQDEQCFNIWVIEKKHVIATHKDDLIWRLSDQNYRRASGYTKQVREKWASFRNEESLASYRKDDIKKAFE
tara:strand:+ start:169 stop:561 length:393 start_codon:yes stop_codon:yes gene_type:complete